MAATSLPPYNYSDSAQFVDVHRVFGTLLGTTSPDSTSTRRADWDIVLSSVLAVLVLSCRCLLLHHVTTFIHHLQLGIQPRGTDSLSLMRQTLWRTGERRDVDSSREPHVLMFGEWMFHMRLQLCQASQAWLSSSCSHRSPYGRQEFQHCLERKHHHVRH